MLVDKKVDLNKLTQPNVKVNIDSGRMPNVIGLIGKNVIPQLENLGYKVDYKGVGKIKEQFPLEGVQMGKKQKIYLTMQY